jgi:hypothetical protein
VVTVTVHKIPGEDTPYAVVLRPGSTVKSRVEGELIISEVAWTGRMETQTTTIIMPIDVAVSHLESLQLPELARWTHSATNEF